MSTLYLEALEKNGDVRARLALDDAKKGTTLRVGRAPDCDLVLDDPYTAQVHARIEYADGVWWLSDAGSVNGLLLGGKPHSKVVLDPSNSTVLKLGQTVLRVRASGAAVAPERALPPARGDLSAKGLLVASLLFLGFLVFSQWVSSVAPSTPSQWVTSVGGPIGFLLAWTVAWSVLSRVFSGDPWFNRHLGIALVAILGFFILPMLWEKLAFALSWPLILPLVDWLRIGVTVWAVWRHLELAFGQVERWQVGLLIVLGIVPVVLGVFSQQERRAQWFDNGVIKAVADPSLRVVSNKPPSALFTGLEARKAEIDALVKRPDSSEGEE